MTDLATTELTADEARALTGEIRQRLDGLLPLIKRAYEGRADRALGYESWQAYCAAELNDVRVPLADRPAMVAELRAAGMSQRAIGSALGVSKRTVETDLASSSHLPTSIQGTDGKRYAATRPHTPAITPEPEPDGTDVAAGSGPHTPARQDPDPVGPGVATTGGPDPVGPAVDFPPPPARSIPLPDLDALAAEARAKFEQEQADRRALLAPREVVEAVNAATHFVPAMVAIRSGCEDFLFHVKDVDPEKAVTDLPGHLLDRLSVARDAHAYLTRVVETLDQIGVPA